MRAILLLTLLFALAYSHRIIRCLPNKEYQYSIQTDIQTLGQNKITVLANLALHCVGSQNKGAQDLLSFRVKVGKITFKQDGGAKDYPRKVDGFTEFDINRQGEIQAYKHLKNEDPIVTSIKKSFVTFFETKLRGISRIETNQVGKIKYTYQHRLDEKGRNIVVKTAGPQDVLARSDKRIPLKTSRYNYKGVAYFSRDGELIGAETVVSDVVGEPGPARKRSFLKLKKGAEKDTPDTPEFVKSAKGSHTKTILKLDKTVNIMKPVQRFTKLLEAGELSYEDVKITDMGFDDTTAAAVDVLHKKILSKRIDYPHLLERVRTESRPEVMAEAHTATNVLGSEALRHVEDKFNTLDFKNKEHIEYATRLQSLMVAAQNEHGQTLFVKTLGNPHLVLGGIIKALSVEKPSEQLVDKLHTLSKSKLEDFGSDAHILEKELDMVKTSSYMVYAHTASALHEHNREKAKEIVLNISDRMANAQDFHELSYAVHALGNAGEAVPLSAIQEIIDNEEIPLNIKVSAVNGLSKRTSERSEHETTEFIHTLVHEHPEETVKIAAVHAQLERERENPTGASVEEFGLHLDNPTMSLSVKDAINKYLDETVEEVEQEDTTVLDAKEEAKKIWENLKGRLGVSSAAFDPAFKVCVRPNKGAKPEFCTQAAGAGQFLTDQMGKQNFEQYTSSSYDVKETISGPQFSYRVDSDITYSGEMEKNQQQENLLKYFSIFKEKKDMDPFSTDTLTMLHSTKS